ncbi:PDR/VanB family oxidoreductase [Arhodomonas aquaeolei]|uniref:PDR/VanB family oxidoreductase n=1 Tax=Arhodomonas aquaeolei TaxID=2369 RepID=UPI00036216DF|nr:PDR/VanB family oxidoreductase [Arhodomonas aquaeolei]
MTKLELEVRAAEWLTPQIRRIELQRAGGGTLPGFTPGAHLRFELPLDGGSGQRQYSLIVTRADAAAMAAPERYVIAVRREADGRGGSAYMHERLQPGDRLTAEGPVNDFPLHEGGGRAVLIAGGIGVTPILSMAAALTAAGRDYRFHYSGRSRGQLVFVDEIRALAGERLSVHADDEPDTALDLDALLAGYGPADHLYVCGPGGMIDALTAGARARGWPPEHVHFELFTAAAPQAGDHAFEVECRASGVTLQVAADQTILEAAEAAGLDPMSDCERGECGVCSTEVIEGEVDHRDHYLSDDEKASNSVMQICISRARGERLVLDL